MSSFGAGGGSATGQGGGMKSTLSGLGLDSIVKQFGQQLGQGVGASQDQMGVQPGRMAQMSPQQRFAQAMRMYGGQG